MSAGGGGTTGARLLLRRLRGLMAEGGSAEERLDQIVRAIAAGMVAEVCSVYVMRAGEVLELFATEGLKPEAVHHTRLRVGEGLVGDIASHARPLALADAQSHPNFAYRPETGEEIYQVADGRADPARRPGASACWSVQNRTRAPIHRGGGRGAARPSPWCVAELVAERRARAARRDRGRPRASACCRRAWRA